MTRDEFIYYWMFVVVFFPLGVMFMGSIFGIGLFIMVIPFVNVIKKFVMGIDKE